MLQSLIIDDKIIFQHPFKAKSEVVNHLLNLISRHDTGTARHSYNVAEIAVKFANTLNLPCEMVENIGTAALLHDIGKIKIPKDILNKPEKLTADEFEVIKKHSQYGFEILNNIGQLKDIAEAVYCHHEKYNGKGYPNGKVGQEIPFISQILSITDVYDALTSDRIYRKAMTPKEAFKVIHSEMESHFNTKLVNRFLLGGC
jgi:putative nucleotidyltransferase with HDIG domain